MSSNLTSSARKSDNHGVSLGELIKQHTETAHKLLFLDLSQKLALVIFIGSINKMNQTVRSVPGGLFLFLNRDFTVEPSLRRHALLRLIEVVSHILQKALHL